MSILNLALSLSQIVRNLPHRSPWWLRILFYQVPVYRPRARKKKFLDWVLEDQPRHRSIPAFTGDMFGLSHKLTSWNQTKPTGKGRNRGWSGFLWAIWAAFAGKKKKTDVRQARSFPTQPVTLVTTPLSTTYTFHWRFLLKFICFLFNPSSLPYSIEEST